MTTITRAITFDYQFDSAHKGAPYTIDGTHYMNGGEFKEVVAKDVTGYMGAKDANTRYDMGSDIPEMNASVKSSKATLVNMVLGATFEESVDTYFANVHSTLFIYMVDIGEQITEYHMNAEEFREFVENWAGLAVDSGTHLTKVRFKKTSGKMIKWLEERAA